MSDCGSVVVIMKCNGSKVVEFMFAYKALYCFFIGATDQLYVVVRVMFFMSMVSSNDQWLVLRKRNK